MEAVQEFRQCKGKWVKQMESSKGTASLFIHKHIDVTVTTTLPN